MPQTGTPHRPARRTSRRAGAAPRPVANRVGLRVAVGEFRPCDVSAQGLLRPVRMIGEESFHPDTRALLAYGRALAGQGPSPARALAGGADHLAERLFVFDRSGDGRLIVRTFGAELVTLFGSDLKDRDLCGIWPEGDHALLRAFVAAVGAAAAPGVARALGETACGRRIGMEMLLTPLRMVPSTSDRFLGLFQPLGGQAFLNGRTVVVLRLGALHLPEGRIQPAGLRLVVSNS